jgi:PAS domain-containing protein
MESDVWKLRYDIASVALGRVVYDYDTATGSILWSDSLEQVLGYDPAQMKGGIAQWADLIHPEDRWALIGELDLRKVCSLRGRVSLPAQERRLGLDARPWRVRSQRGRQSGAPDRHAAGYHGGVLDVHSDQVGALTQEDQIILTDLAGQIAIAIENARRLEKD